VILDLLVQRGELYGLELVEESNGALKRGTIYTTLARMLRKGFVESRKQQTPGQAGLPRRLYRPTGLGEHVLLMAKSREVALTEAYPS
jgi:DNA-binding PadR family transcriptional regulator